MDVSVSIKGMDKALLMLDEKKVRRAARMAVNDGVTTGRKVASQEIRKVWNIKAARINKELRKLKAPTTADLTGIIRAKGQPISLVHFGAKHVRGRTTTTGTKSTRSKRAKKTGGVFVQIKRGRKTRLPHAFIATMPNRHIGVMERLGKSRLKIQSKSSVTIATMFNQRRVMLPTLKQIDDRMNKRLDHHLNRLLR